MYCPFLSASLPGQGQLQPLTLNPDNVYLRQHQHRHQLQPFILLPDLLSDFPNDFVLHLVYLPRPQSPSPTLVNHLEIIGGHLVTLVDQQTPADWKISKCVTYQLTNQNDGPTHRARC